MVQAELRLRLLLVMMVVVTLLAAMWAGLVRLGWGWPALRPLLPALHGPLMVSGFLGTLISLERAVALRQRRFYLGPAVTGLGGLWLLIGLPMVIGQVLVLLGSLGLTAVSLVIFRRHKAWYTAVMGLGAVCWLVGNGLWLAGWPIHQFVYGWAGFLILTIVGERLELSRVRRLTPGSYGWFWGATAVFGAGLILSLVVDAGVRLASVGLLVLAAWLLRYDIARRTAWLPGLTGYIGRNLLAGYLWLVIGSLSGLAWGRMVAGPRYDLWLHAIFLGFAFGMIFAHALIILPSITGVPITYRPIFYAPTLLLQGSLLLRMVGDLGNLTLRQWGGLFNAVAILLFFGLIASSLIKSRIKDKRP